MTATDAYGSRAIRRARRSKAEMDNIRAHLYDVLASSESAMTVRQVFYQMVSRGLPKPRSTDRLRGRGVVSRRPRVDWRRVWGWWL
jgi:hypothetical protein